MSFPNPIEVVDGRPYIWGMPATWDEEESVMPDLSSQWRCPHCNARLSTSGFICLNACHLTAPQIQKFTQGISEAVSKVKAQE